MHSLEAFIAATHSWISQHGFDDVMDFVPQFEALQLGNWPTLLNQQDGKPVNTTLYQSDKIRMVIICWEGGQESSIHGHKEGGGLIKVLSGRLEETRFDPVDGATMGTYHYQPGAFSYIHDMFAIHQVKNPDQRPAYSLHLYTRAA